MDNKAYAVKIRELLLDVMALEERYAEIGALSKPAVLFASLVDELSTMSARAEWGGISKKEAK